MDIIINATKDGYRTLFSTNDDLAYLIAKDVRSGANNDSSLGHFAHSIFFIEKGCVFTKYIIVKDTQRSNALGFIAFSLFIANDESLKGEVVESILDELSNEYSEKYIINSYLNRGEKNLIREDWNFINDILRKYNELDKGQKDKEFQSGIKEAAFIYYNNEVPLREYFDKPLQDEYIEYKQVFFINTDLKGSQKNPLNILSNSGKELEKIDLKNEPYYLKGYDRSKGITIRANHKVVTDGKNNNCIKAKWQVEISCPKDDICFESINEKGYLFDPNIQKYLEVKNKDIIIRYNSFIKPIVKTISFEIRNKNGAYIDNAEILINNKLSKTIDGNKFECEFIGDEIKKRWVISVKRGDYSLVDNDFVPEKANKKTELILKEHRNIPIIIRDRKTNYELHDFEVLTKLTNSYQRIKNLEFVDEQIRDSYGISFRIKGYEDLYIPDFKPFIDVKIEKTVKENEDRKDLQNQSYLIDSGEHGKKSSNCPGYSNLHNGSDLDKKVIIENNGWKFIGWKLDVQKNTLIAQYEKEEPFIKRPLFISGTVILVLAIIFGVWSIFKTDKVNKTDCIDSEEIQIYVDGDILSLEKLNKYKTDLELHMPEVIEINKYKRWFMGSEKQLDSTALMNWRNDTLNINEAIKKRNLLNKKDFVELKKLEYSTNQQNLKKAIDNIDINKYKEFSKVLGNVNNKTLSEIAEVIKSAFKQKEFITKKPQEIVNETDNVGNKIVPTTPKVEKQKPISVKPVKPIVVNSPDKNKNIEISNKLKGSSISIEELNKFRDENPKFKKSIQLYIDFLEKVQSNNDQKQDYDNLLSKIKAEDIFNNSELKSFLNFICSTSDSFEKYNSIRGKKNCKTLEKLKNKMK